jgi:hypothetical protein
MDTYQYGQVRNQIVALLQATHAASARRVNALVTASYWKVGLHAKRNSTIPGSMAWNPPYFFIQPSLNAPRRTG